MSAFLILIPIAVSFRGRRRSSPTVGSGRGGSFSIVLIAVTVAVRRRSRCPRRLRDHDTGRSWPDVLIVTAAVTILSFQCQDQQEYNARKDHNPYGHPEKNVSVVSFLVHLNIHLIRPSGTCLACRLGPR